METNTGSGTQSPSPVSHIQTLRKLAELDLQKTLSKLKHDVLATVKAMVSSMAARDRYVYGHQIRSVDLAVKIAMEIPLDQDRINGIRMAGAIYDIGKLSLPPETAAKTADMVNTESTLIKDHPRIGYEMLKDVPSPWQLAEMIYQHHERVDGSGYPRNLKGEEILMEARILGVADVVESMSTRRPYRPALTIEAVLEEIEKNKGIIYDSTVVDACLRLFREKLYQFPKLPPSLRY